MRSPNISAIMRTTFLVVVLIPAFSVLRGQVSYADECGADPEFCVEPTPEVCWDDDVGADICDEGLPDPCVPSADPVFVFTDDDSDGQLMALNNSSGAMSCGTLTVPETGYYSIFDSELSESCTDQQDETGYLSITNSCNTQGTSTVRNAGHRYLVPDTDNTPECNNDDSNCAAGNVCRSNGHGTCCVPAEPVFMGTFLLVGGEDNRICIHHWCPEWEADPTLGFVNNDCGNPGAINSIHFQINANALACEEDTLLQDCSFGCFAGECADDPCDAADCELFCQDGVCTDDNPCADLDCEYGCSNGLCLQAPDTPGSDGDSDGYSNVADCDDTDPLVNPGQTEDCTNDIDDDCDGLVDESDCGEGGSNAGADSGPGAGEPSNGGCGCSVGGTRGSLGGLFWLGAVLMILVRRRRATV